VVHLRWFLIIRQAHKSEADVDDEEKGDYVLGEEDLVIADIEIDSCEVHRGEARVGDDDEHDSVPVVETLVIRAQFQSLLAANLLLLFQRVFDRRRVILTFIGLIVSLLLPICSLTEAIHLFLHIACAID